MDVCQLAEGDVALKPVGAAVLSSWAALMLARAVVWAGFFPICEKSEW